jgi:glutaredoxin
MNNYYLYSVVLENCPYSEAASKLLNRHSNISKEIISVNKDNKENYKTYQINTFPQIYFKKKYKSGSLLIGGYEELLDKIIIEDKIYYYENKEKGKIFDVTNKEVGIFKNGSMLLNL